MGVGVLMICSKILRSGNLWNALLQWCVSDHLHLLWITLTLDSGRKTFLIGLTFFENLYILYVSFVNKWPQCLSKYFSYHVCIKLLFLRHQTLQWLTSDTHRSRGGVGVVPNTSPFLQPPGPPSDNIRRKSPFSGNVVLTWLQTASLNITVPVVSYLLFF